MKQGVVCVIVSKPDGHVLGIGADFEEVGAAGFSTEDNQARRARAQANMDFVWRQCSGLIVKGMDAYECDKLVDRLRQRDLVVVEVETVGGEAQS
jgi:hypothetical protein